VVGSGEYKTWETPVKWREVAYIEILAFVEWS
jgi:hypothetical protein